MENKQMKRCNVCGTTTEFYHEHVFAPRYFHGNGIMCKLCYDMWLRAVTEEELAHLDNRAIGKIKK